MSKRSKVYRTLGLAEQQLSEDELLELMVQEPTLLRRPLVISGDGVAIGYNQKRLQELTDAGTDDN